MSLRQKGRIMDYSRCKFFFREYGGLFNPKLFEEIYEAFNQNACKLVTEDRHWENAMLLAAQALHTNLIDKKYLGKNQLPLPIITACANYITIFHSSIMKVMGLNSHTAAMYAIVTAMEYCMRKENDEENVPKTKDVS